MEGVIISLMTNLKKLSDELEQEEKQLRNLQEQQHQFHQEIFPK